MTKRILLVEDDLLNRMFLSAALETANFVVEQVTDGAEVMQRVEEFAPDLIIMDINLPSISGLELIKTLKADPALRHIPIIALTAYVAKADEARIREAGASEFLGKPVSVKSLLAAIGRHLRD